jgi:2,4-dienoyl-CoA reductase-like NADH-dependent reductase (Old Yellow Enzyme family)
MTENEYLPDVPAKESNGERLKFLVGINTGYVTDGTIENRLIEFYRRRSSPALYCAIVGNAVIPGGFAVNARSPQISDSPEWAQLARAIASRGSLPGIQLSTAWKDYAASRSFRPRTAREVIRQARELVGTLGACGIASTLANLEEATNLALEAGFRHLQVHAAHGYLLNLLVDDRLNERASDVLEWLARWASQRSAAGVETSIRISLRTGDEDFDANGTDRFHMLIAALPFDFVDVSSGFYGIDKQLIYPARPDMLRTRRAETISLAQRFPERRFILSGRALREPARALPPNIHLGLCRDLIANPDYLVSQSRGCANSGKCHYFSRGVDYVTCPQWSRSTLDV